MKVKSRFPLKVAWISFNYIQSHLFELSISDRFKDVIRRVQASRNAHDPRRFTIPLRDDTTSVILPPKRVPSVFHRTSLKRCGHTG
jgi:hypothetical protein